MHTFTWSDWPAPRHPTRSFGAAVIILVATLAISTIDPFLAVAGGVILVAATAEVLLPTRYELSGEGVKVLGPFSRRSQAWSRIAEWQSLPEGFLLVGRGSRPVLARKRTIVLRCVEQRTAVETLLQRLVPHNETPGT